MDTINLIATIYKQQLAEANEQKILFQAQCELYKAQIEELKKELKEKNEKIENLQVQIPHIVEEK